MKNFLISLIVLVLLFVISFLIWHFFLSIYEVKYKSIPDTLNVKCNSEIRIKIIGINSFGWELPFRKIKSKVEVLKGSDLIELSEEKNKIIIKTLSEEGEVLIKIKPELALSATEFLFLVKK